MRRSLLTALLASLLLILQGLIARGQAVVGDDEKGKVVAKKDRYGQYMQYLPPREARGILVIVHGMPTEEQSKNVIGLAEKFLRRWVAFADEHQLIALAPAFDQENFGSVAGDFGGGYRGLFGRQIGADEFVNRIVVQYRPRVKSWDGRFLLYGHSAGGQFVNHYCVVHPDRVRAAVISAAGGYAMPDPSVHWPHGMGPWTTSFRWDPAQAPQPIHVRPNPAGWRRAALLPLTVVVGTEDTEAQKPRAGHAGRTRVEYAQQWVGSMNRLARRPQKEDRIRLVLVPGVGHDSARLTPTAQEALAAVLKAP
jgi:pimeloyl-ACP methyl ester carboxylesterase